MSNTPDWQELFSAQQKSTSSSLEHNLLVLGSPSSGKHSLLAKVFSAKRTRTTSARLHTPKQPYLVDYHAVQLPLSRDSTTTIGLWICNQDAWVSSLIPHSPHAQYAALIVVDLTQMRDIKREMKKWIATLQSFQPSIKIILVITKADLIYQIAEDFVFEKYPNETTDQIFKDHFTNFIQYHLRRFAAKHEASLIYTSESNETNFQLLFDLIVNIFVSHLENKHFIESTQEKPPHAVFIPQINATTPNLEYHKILQNESQSKFYQVLPPNLNESTPTLTASGDGPPAVEDLDDFLSQKYIRYSGTASTKLGSYRSSLFSSERSPLKRQHSSLAVDISSMSTSSDDPVSSVSVSERRNFVRSSSSGALLGSTNETNVSTPVAQATTKEAESFFKSMLSNRMYTKSK